MVYASKFLPYLSPYPMRLQLRAMTLLLLGTQSYHLSACIIYVAIFTIKHCKIVARARSKYRLEEKYWKRSILVESNLSYAFKRNMSESYIYSVMTLFLFTIKFFRLSY